MGCWRGPGGSLCLDAMRGNPLNDLHTPAAEAITAVLAARSAGSGSRVSACAGTAGPTTG
jgi:hypothetical protein